MDAGYATGLDVSENMEVLLCEVKDFHTITTVQVQEFTQSEM